MNKFKNYFVLVFFCLFITTQISSQTLVHYWNFNNNTTLSSLFTPTVSQVLGASIKVNPGGSSFIDSFGGTGQDFNINNLNSRNGDSSGSHLRFNNPIGGELEFLLPTIGYTNITVSFATRRSGSGAGKQYWHYSTDGINFILFDSIFPSSSAPELKTLNFVGVEGVANNSDFRLKVSFAKGLGGDVGNNRFDNFALDGNATEELLHYWNFNDISSYNAHTAPSFTVGGAMLDTIQFAGGSSLLAFSAGTNSDLDKNLNAKRGDSAGTHLRFNNPVYGALVFSLPTLGYENIVVKYASARSGSGAHWQFVEYTTDAVNYVLYDTMLPEEGTNQKLFEIDLRKIKEVNNNPDFKIRIRFGQGGGGLAGNNRIDNFSVESIAPDLTGSVTGVEVSPKEVLLEIGNSHVFVAEISPVDALDTSVSWSSSKAGIAFIDSNGKVDAISAGTAMVYATTNDGGFVDSAKVIVVAPPTLDVIHYWHFNSFSPTEDVKEIAADYTLLNNSNPKFTYTLVPSDSVINERDMDSYSPGSLLNSQQGQSAGIAARVRNPSVNRSLVFDLPTSGVESVVFSLTVQRSSNGMLTNTIEYSVDGINFTSNGLVDNVKNVQDFEVWQIHSYDFSAITAANNNPNFKIRITWKDANASNTSGNNRYDNIVLMGNGAKASISSVYNMSSLICYPNPTNGLLTVSLNNNQKLEYISIIDSQGKVVLESDYHIVDMSSLPNGLYFVMSVVDGVTLRNKILLKK